MKKITIKQNGEIKQIAEFKNNSLLEDFIETLKAGKTAWGKDEFSVIDTPEVRNEEYPYEIITEATYRTIPAEFTYGVKDITAEVELEESKKELKKTDRVSRIDQLKAIDWNAVTTVAHLKTIVKALTKEAIKDDE